MEQQEFVKKHGEYSKMLMYPPFTTSLKKREDYMADLQKESNRIATLISQDDESALERMYSTLEAKWADDLDEARLYQKRYPDNPKDAQQAVLKMEGRDGGIDADLPLGIF